MANLSPPFQNNGGYCWLANLSHEEQKMGDTEANPIQSSLVLLEDKKQLGPSHSLHEAIRQHGSGRFSHWKHQIYFSTSDNSNPNSNGRKYQVIFPEVRNIEPETITQIAHDETLLFSAVRQNVNQNDRALCNVLHCYRAVNRLLGLVGESVNEKVVLEMGTSREPGLPLVLLFVGAAKYYANNIFPVSDWVSEAYAQLIYLILSGVLPYDLVNWSDVCADEIDQAGTRIARLRSEKFVSLSPVAAEDLTLPENSVDLIFSFSVLEHVTKPQDVIRNMFRMLKPGGIVIHGIDLRDHSNFSRPLDFLMHSPDDYLLKTAATENRWRASDFLDCFTAEGFELLKQLFRDSPPALTSDMKSDVFEVIMQPFESGFKGSLDSVNPWVTNQMRAKFDSLYRSKSLTDLSILTMALIMRKP